MTGSALVRGAMTALRWAFRGKTDLRAFAPGLEREALQWLSEGVSFDVEAAYNFVRMDAEITGYPGFKTGSKTSSK